MSAIHHEALETNPRPREVMSAASSGAVKAPEFANSITWDSEISPFKSESDMKMLMEQGAEVQ